MVVGRVQWRCDGGYMVVVVVKWLFVVCHGGDEVARWWFGD